MAIAAEPAAGALPEHTVNGTPSHRGLVTCRVRQAQVSVLRAGPAPGSPVWEGTWRVPIVPAV
jgi:hypothetical protein